MVIMKENNSGEVRYGKSIPKCALSTVVNVLSGVLILGDAFSLLQGIATALILIGTTMANTLPKGAVEIKTENR